MTVSSTRIALVGVGVGLTRQHVDDVVMWLDADGAAYLEARRNAPDAKLLHELAFCCLPCGSVVSALHRAGPSVSWLSACISARRNVAVPVVVSPGTFRLDQRRTTPRPSARSPHGERMS